MTKKKKARKKVYARKRAIGIDIGQILLKQRHLFLTDVIDAGLMNKIIQEMYALDTLNHKPIVLAINSPGGSVSAGMAIIDAMRAVKSPVITFVTGQACSMAAIISVCGNKRFMTQNSIWMAHPMSAGVIDYTTFMRDRMKGLDLFERIMDDVLKKQTKLTAEEIASTSRGEMWLTSQECLKKGIVDAVILGEKR